MATDPQLPNSWDPRRPKIRVSGYSFPPVFNSQFLMGLAEEVLKHLQRYVGGDMTIIGVNNRHPAAKYSGLVGFDIRRSEFDLAAIGVQFGPGSSDNPVVRRGFGAAGWLEDPIFHENTCIHVVNFDEAWALLCHLGNKLEPRAIELCYGR